MTLKSASSKLVSILLLLIPVTLFGQIRLPKLIGDGMVLQREAEVKIWGWAARSEEVSVKFNDKVYEAVADEAGKWEIVLTDLPTGGPYTMQLEASNTIIIKDILVGDVWVCSGQSNMELPMRRVRPIYEEEITKADYPHNRYFSVQKRYDFN